MKKSKGHATNPQITLLLALFGERDWSLSGERELIERIEQLHAAGMEVWVKRDFHKPQGVVMNEFLTSRNQPGLGLDEAIQLITWLKSLPRVTVYDDIEDDVQEEV